MIPTVPKLWLRPNKCLQGKSFIPIQTYLIPKPSTNGTTGQVLTYGADGKPYWN
jgi:hypothetical protein